MKRIGLVGGMTPESTKDYYATLIDLGRERLEGTVNVPIIIVYSINLHELFGLMEDRKRAIGLLVNAVNNLQSAGAQVGALTANTVHVFFDEIVEATSLPLISIVDTTFDAAKVLGCKKILLLGTSTTMASGMFPSRFAQGGMEVLVPNEEERGFVNGSIEKELAVGVVRQGTKKGFIELCERYIAEKGIEAIILGCTEIPMILKDGDLEVPLLNTARLHCESIFQRAQDQLGRP